MMLSIKQLNRLYLDNFTTLIFASFWWSFVGVGRIISTAGVLVYWLSSDVTG